MSKTSEELPVKSKTVKYILSISFSLFLFLTLMLSHDYIENPWNQLYEIIVVFSLIFLLFWKKKTLILISCAIVGPLFWVVNRYVGHPIDYLLQSMIVMELIFIALIICRKSNALTS